MSPEAPESVADAPRGSKANPDALPGSQNRSPEAHIGVEICWLGTNDIEHGPHAARFQHIGAKLGFAKLVQPQMASLIPGMWEFCEILTTP